MRSFFDSKGQILGLLALLVFAGCSTTEYARIQATGMHAITPYGILSVGILDYQRYARPGETSEVKTKAKVSDALPEPQPASQHTASVP
jgi:hypothetical protein